MATSMEAKEAKAEVTVESLVAMNAQASSFVYVRLHFYLYYYTYPLPYVEYYYVQYVEWKNEEQYSSI